MADVDAWPMFTDFFHLGYVTETLKGSLDEFSSNTGVDDFALNHDLAVPIQRRGEDAVLRFHLALAWAGETMVELIEPLEEGDGFYRDAIAEGERSIVLHHIGVEVPSGSEKWDRLRSTYENRGHPFDVYGEFGDRSTFAYVDLTGSLGHHVEFVSYTEKGREFLDEIPRNPARDLPV